MSLEQLNDKLHGRDVHLDRGTHFTPYDPEHPEATKEEVAAFQQTEKWQDGKTKEPDLLLIQTKKKHRYRALAIGFGIVTIILLAGGVAFKMRSSLFSEDRVVISLSGPQNVASAEEVSFTITYSNGNWTDIHDATLIVTYPETFRLEKTSETTVSGQHLEIPVGDVPRGEKGEKKLSGKFYGSKGELGYLNATLRYTPKGFRSEFEKEVRYGVTIASSPLALEVSAPQELASGQEIDYVIEYRNESDAAFPNLRVRAEYPGGFQFMSGEPGPSEGENLWNIGTLAPGGSGKILVHGALSGSRDEYKEIRAEIGLPQGDGNLLVYNENERQTKMITSPLSIAQTVNGGATLTANPGDVLNYEVKYRNDGNIGLREAVVTLEIDSSYLDMKSLILPKGSYDESTKTITWRASDASELTNVQPGASGSFTFRVPIQKSIKIPSGGTKSISIRSVAKIDSPDVPAIAGSNKVIGSNILLVKLGALVSIGLEGLYSDSPIGNSGPIPPVVGEETTYVIRLSLENSSNDITQSRIVLAFPSGIVYKNKFVPEGETVTFNERTNEFTWEAGTLSPGKTKTVSLQVGITPNSSQTGKPPILLNKATFSGKDTFTSQTIRIEKNGDTLTTNVSNNNIRPK